MSEKGEWKDYDAPSCYTVILNMLRPIDYASFRTSKCIDDYIVGDRFGMALVRFRHPVGAKIPTLPVHAGNRGLLYVMKGETVVVISQLLQRRYFMGAVLSFNWLFATC